MNNQNFDFDAFQMNGLSFFAKVGNAFAMAAFRKVINSIRTEDRPANVPLKSILQDVVGIELQVANILTDDDKQNEKQLLEHFEKYGEEYLRAFAKNVVEIAKIKGKNSKFLAGMAELLEIALED